MYNKKLYNNVSYNKENMEEKMNNEKLYIDDLIKNDELYKGMVVDDLLVVDKLIYNNKFINNQLIKVYSLGMDEKYSNLDWRNIKDDLIQDVILLTLEAGKESLTFKEFYSICNKVLYNNLKHWTREVQASALTARHEKNIPEHEKLDNYLLDNSSYKGCQSVESQVVKKITMKESVDELLRVVTPTQQKYITKYILNDGCYEVNMVKDRILKASKRSLYLRELYNI